MFCIDRLIEFMRHYACTSLKLWNYACTRTVCKYSILVTVIPILEVLNMFFNSLHTNKLKKHDCDDQVSENDCGKLILSKII